MKKKRTLNLLFFLCGFLVLQSCTKTSYTGVKQEKFSQFSNTCKPYLLIDTRSKEDYDNMHTKSAINIPFSENFLSDLEKCANNKHIQNNFILFLYGPTAFITNNQVNEIKQHLKEQKTLKISSVYYLKDDYTF